MPPPVSLVHAHNEKQQDAHAESPRGSILLFRRQGKTL
jgi:hypothetical protein